MQDGDCSISIQWLIFSYILISLVFLVRMNAVSEYMNISLSSFQLSSLVSGALPPDFQWGSGSGPCWGLSLSYPRSKILAMSLDMQHEYGHRRCSDPTVDKQSNININDSQSNININDKLNCYL